MRDALRQRDDHGIGSLVDLALDLEHERYRRIIELRNAQTHRCLVLTKDSGYEIGARGIARIGRRPMHEETLRLLRTVKSALFSVAVLVRAEEKRRAGSGPRLVTRSEIGTDQDLDWPHAEAD